MLISQVEAMGRQFMVSQGSLGGGLGLWCQAALRCMVCLPFTAHFMGEMTLHGVWVTANHFTTNYCCYFYYCNYI